MPLTSSASLTWGNGAMFSKLSFEKRFPAYIGAATFIASLIWGGSVVGALRDGTISVDGLYGAAFDWSAIQTAFGFAIFSFATSYTGDFVAKLRETKAYQVFISYIMNAMTSGFILTGTSIPFLVFQPKPEHWLSVSYFLMSMWLSLFTYSVASFYRVGRIMWIIARTPDKNDFPR